MVWKLNGDGKLRVSLANALTFVTMIVAAVVWISSSMADVKTEVGTVQMKMEFIKVSQDKTEKKIDDLTDGINELKVRMARMEGP